MHQAKYAGAQSSLEVPSRLVVPKYLLEGLPLAAVITHTPTTSLDKEIPHLATVVNTVHLLHRSSVGPRGRGLAETCEVLSILSECYRFAINGPFDPFWSRILRVQSGLRNSELISIVFYNHGLRT